LFKKNNIPTLTKYFFSQKNIYPTQGGLFYKKLLDESSVRYNWKNILQYKKYGARQTCCLILSKFHFVVAGQPALRTPPAMKTMLLQTFLFFFFFFCETDAFLLKYCFFKVDHFTLYFFFYCFFLFIFEMACLGL